MAAFDVNIKSGLVALATAIKQNRINTGDLASLSTTAKGSIVAALNEVRSLAASGSSGSTIDDSAASNSTTKTYSAAKISQVVLAAKNDILGGASAAYDTLVEIQALFQANDGSITTIMNALAKRLRVDSTQTLTTTELQQGRDNLSVWSKAEVGDVAHDYVADVNAALA